MLTPRVVSTSVMAKPLRMLADASSSTLGKVPKVISGASFTSVSETVFVAVLLGAPVALLRTVKPTFLGGCCGLFALLAVVCHLPRNGLHGGDVALALRVTSSVKCARTSYRPHICTV